MDFINLAHGVQYMLGAYIAASAGLWAGSFWVGLAVTLPAALALGLLLEVLVFRHLYGRDHLSQVLATVRRHPERWMRACGRSGAARRSRCCSRRGLEGGSR